MYPGARYTGPDDMLITRFPWKLHGDGFLVSLFPKENPPLLFRPSARPNVEVVLPTRKSKHTIKHVYL